MNDKTGEFWQSKDGRFLSWAHSVFARELDLQRVSLSERARDCDFYDGEQFTAEEKAIYDQRDQVPRVFNLIKPTIDWMLGSERRNRSDWNILPRSEDDVEPALVKTKLMKYIDDVNNARWQRSNAFADMIKSGEGWTRVCIEPNEDGTAQVMLKHEHWRNMLRDSVSRRQDLSDCRYVFCTKPVDTEVLKAWFPDKVIEIDGDAGDFEDLRLEQQSEMHPESSVQHFNSSGAAVVRVGSMALSGGNYLTERKAVRVWEMWYRKTERVKVLRDAGTLSGVIYNPDDESHLYATAQGAEVRETVREQMHMAMFTRNTVLYNGRSVYEHNRFPFVLRLGHVTDSDGMPYGVIRQLRDPQADLNARRNKALFLMSTSRVIMDAGAVDDVNALACEVAKPNGIITKSMGRDFNIQDGGVLAPQHVAMAQQDEAYIRQVSGVTGENQGMSSTATSGIAIQSLQEQGSIITTALIDNHALGHQIEGEIVLSLCEQYMDKPMQFRITGDDIKKPQFASANDGSPSTDITASKADFVVSQKDYRQTYRQALSEQMMGVASSITQATGDPALAVALIESAIELQDLPNKAQLTARLRQAAGLPPVDETDEQKQQREQAEAQAKQAQDQMAQQVQQTAMRLESARADEMEAQAVERKAEAQREMANATSHKVNAVKSAMEAAELVKNRADLAPIVDDLIGSLDEVLQVNPVAPPAQAMPQQPMPEQQMPPNPMQQEQLK